MGVDLVVLPRRAGGAPPMPLARRRAAPQGDALGWMCRPVGAGSVY